MRLKFSLSKILYTYNKFPSGVKTSRAYFWIITISKAHLVSEMCSTIAMCLFFIYSKIEEKKIEEKMWKEASKHHQIVVIHSTVYNQLTVGLEREGEIEINQAYPMLWTSRCEFDQFCVMPQTLRKHCMRKSCKYINGKETQVFFSAVIWNWTI